mgnify:FL=1
MFFASELARRKLTEEQTDALWDILFPKDYSDHRSVTQSTLKQQVAYERWHKQHEYEEAQKPKEVKPELISDEEMEYFAEMGAF